MNERAIQIIDLLLEKHPKLNLARLARRIGYGRTVISEVYNKKRKASSDLETKLEEALRIPSIADMDDERSHGRVSGRSDDHAPLGNAPPSSSRPYAGFESPILFDKLKQLTKDLPKSEPFTAISILTAIKEVAEELKLRVFKG